MITDKTHKYGKFKTQKELEAFIAPARKVYVKGEKHTLVKAQSMMEAESYNTTANVSRDTFIAANNYERVILEQGVPIQDCDINEIGEATLYRHHQDILITLGTGFSGNAWQVQGTSLSNDFVIAAGVGFLADSPNGGTVPSGNCLTAAGQNYTAQSYSIQGVPNYPVALAPPGSGTRTDTVWLESWYQDYGPADDVNIYSTNPLLGGTYDFSHRGKIITVVRVWAGSGAYTAALAISGAPFYNAAHSYFPLAQIVRTTSNNITSGMVSDLRPLIFRGGCNAGTATILATTTSIVVAANMRATSRVQITPDYSLGGAAWGNITPAVSARTIAGFTVTIGSAAPTSGLYFSWEVTY
jgi:hypothetical protein